MATSDNGSATLFEGPDAALLAEIENLQLVSRQAAHGALAGMHRSVRRGTSIEFSEHKVYTPGDDIRHIDWRAFAKTDRFHVKQFEDETNLRVELLIDHSGSMDFASHFDAPGTNAGDVTLSGAPMTKLAFAKILAAALSYLALRQGDATGLTTFAAGVTDELPARASGVHLAEILRRLTLLSATSTTGIVASIDHFAQTRRRRTVTVVMSDLFDPDPELIPAFQRLAARRHDVALFQLLDPAETEFPYDAPATFSSMEDDRRLFVHPRALRTTFVAEMQAFLDRTARALSGIGVDYRPVDTRAVPAQVLGEFLRSRKPRR